MTLRRMLSAAAAAAVLLAGSVTTASAATAATAGTGSADGRSFAHRPGLERLRDVTDKFHRISVATNKGYAELKDVNGISCIVDDMGGMGAMGVHYANVGLVGDGKIIPTQPEAILYAPDTRGHLHLAGVEYVVLKADWLQHHKHRPSLYGHRFNFTPAGNRFGLPDYYSLHVWVWKHNPAGMFQMFNPSVHCPS